jgi:hypothetical protein
MNKCKASHTLNDVVYVSKGVLLIRACLGLAQTSKFSCAEPNVNELISLFEFKYLNGCINLCMLSFMKLVISQRKVKRNNFIECSVRTGPWKNAMLEAFITSACRFSTIY